MTAARAALAMGLALSILIETTAGAGTGEQTAHGLIDRTPKGCVIETRPLSFGAYDPLASTAVAGLGSVIYTCGVQLHGDKGVKNIRINMSRGISNSYDRSMSSGLDRLRYNVYLDASHRTIWGDGSNGTDYYFDPHPPNKTPVMVPAYGTIFAQQDVQAGTYTDVLQVTILF